MNVPGDQLSIGQFYIKIGGRPPNHVFRATVQLSPRARYIQVVPTLTPEDTGASCSVADYFSPDAPVIADYRRIVQGTVGNCWLLAPMCALASSAQFRPQLNTLVTVNPEPRTYTVRFFSVEGVPQEITVTGHLPFLTAEDTGKQAELLYVGQQLHLATVAPSNANLTPSFIEKALAQYSGGYQGLDGGDPPDARQADEGFMMLTGRACITLLPEEISLVNLRAYLAAGCAVVFTTKPNAESAQPMKSEPTDEPEFRNLLEDHAYMVSSVTATRVILYNPHGETPELAHNVAAPLEWADILAVGARFDILVPQAQGGKRKTKSKRRQKRRSYKRSTY